MTTLRVDKQVCPITLGETATFTLNVDDTDAFPAQELRVTSVNPRFNENWVHVIAGPARTTAHESTASWSVPTKVVLTRSESTLFNSVFP